MNMNPKKLVAVCTVSACLAFAGGIAVSEEVRDWHDLEAVHVHVKEAIHELEEARRANHYDMKGHGAKAEEHLRAAEHELGEAVEAARASK